MKKILTKIIGASLAIAMMIGVGAGLNYNKLAKPVDATDYTRIATFDFSSTAASGTSSNSLDAAGIKTLLNDSSDVSDLVTSVTNKSGDVYSGKGSGGGSIPQRTLKIGKASGAGAFTFTIGGNDSISKVVVNGHVWKTTSAISVNSSASQTYATAQSATAHPFEFELATATKSINISVTTSCVCVASIDLYKVASGGGQQEGPSQLAAPVPEYDFDNNRVTWEAVANASGYQLKIGDGEYAAATSPYDGSFVPGTEYTVFVKAIGDGEDYLDSEAGSVTFTAKAPFIAKQYALCTSVEDLEAGANYLFTNSYDDGEVNAMARASKADNRSSTSVTASGEKLTTTVDTLILELGGTSGAWTFQTQNYLDTDGYFAPATENNKNKLRIVEEADTCTISFNADKNAIVTFSSNPGDRNILRYNNGIFACYSSGQAPVYLWKEYIALDHLSIEGSLTKTSYYDSETFDPSGITVKAHYSDSSYKVLAANAVTWEPLTTNMTQIRGSYTEKGVTKYTEYLTISVAADTLSSVTLSGAIGANYFLDDEWDQGTLAVTANYASGSHNIVTNEATIAYYSDSAMNNEVATPADLGAGANQTIYVKATYNAVSNATGYAQTVTVNVEPGTTAENPLSVDVAIEKGLALTGSNETKLYYISGTIASVETNNLSAETNKYATFVFDDSNATVDFKAYHIAPNANLTNYSDLRVGAVAVIQCKIKKYNNTTIENGSVGSLLSLSYTAPTPTAITLNKTSLALEINDDFQLATTLEPLGAEGDIVWSSSNGSVASVSDGGLVTALSKGSAKITAKFSEEVKAECNVVVAEPSRSLSNRITADLTTNASVNNGAFEIEASAKKESGYYQDGSIAVGTVRYFTVKTSSPMFACEPASIVLTAKLGGGSVKEQLTNNVEACFVDSDENEIESTKVTVASNISSMNGSEYSVEIPYSANAYGFKLMHAKETSYNVRYYSFSLFYKYNDTLAVLSGNETNEGVDQVKMTFGATISTSMWNSLQTAYGTITDYGVMMFKTTSVLNSETPVQDRFKVNGALANFHKGSAEISPDGDIYKFSAYVSYSDNTKYGTTVCAAPYIVAGGVYYFLGEIQYSVNTLAQYHLQNGGSNLSTEALNVLAGN